MKRVLLKEVRTITGKPFRLPDGGSGSVECTSLVDLLRLLVFNIPRQALTMDDSDHASKLIKQLENGKGEWLELEDGEYEWIVQKVDAFAPMVFGVNAVSLRDALKEEGEK